MATKPLPISPIGKVKTVVDLSNFFGYLEAEVYCPENVRPILPLKHEGRTIYPTGRWKATYFSEMVKAAQLRGYTIKPLRGLSFTKDYPFTDYINHFYNIKKNSSGVQRHIAKLHLNTLYGAFGRRSESLTTMFVNGDKLTTYLTKYIVKTVVDLGDDKFLLLVVTNQDSKIINQLKITFHNDFVNPPSFVKNNVAIAAAVTAYGQIHMMGIKDTDLVLYSDTDSAITSQPLPNHMIGDGLGKLKDELNGGVIDRAYYLGIKKYVYQYKLDNKLVDKSVFSGVPRNTLSFTDIEQLVNDKGQTLTKLVPNRFVRSLNNLSMVIKPAKVSIHFKPHKQLSNGVYLPPHVDLLKPTLDNRLVRIVGKIKKYIKQYLA